PAGRLLAGGTSGGNVVIWDVATGAHLRTLDAHDGNVWGVAFSPDGKQMASVGKDKIVRVWETTTWKGLHTLRGHTHPARLRCVVFAPDSQRVVSAGYDKTVRIWDAHTGLELVGLEGHTNFIAALAFHPHGDFLASADDVDTVRLWNVSPSLP